MFSVCPMGGNHVYGEVKAGHVMCLNCFTEVTVSHVRDNAYWVPFNSKDWD